MSNKWWKKAVVYEIYCKSFCDSNGDGIGDLRGVMSKLHVLRDLGINCIWFTPIYTSPQVDNGYDVADYRDIEPDYGTLEDFKKLLDSREVGGTALLGITKPVIKAHGSSDAKAIKNAIRQAIFFVETGVNDDIAQFAEDYDEKKLLSDAEKMYGNIDF